MLVVEEIKQGLFDGDLGGGLFKKRIPKQGTGKRSGYRTLLATKNQCKYFFVYGFSKNERENIDETEESAKN